MTVDAAAARPPFPLTPIERRIMGVLVEKAFCTPDAYPLSLNAAVTGCNQKSARDPVTSFSEADIEDALLALKDKGLVEQIYPNSGRVYRWRQKLKDAWGLEGKQRAVLAELFLRGPQTEGDLRSRVVRMQDIPSLEDLGTLLEDLRAKGFVRRLSPDGQKRGVMWMHILYPPGELERTAERFMQKAAEGGADPDPVGGSGSASSGSAGGGRGRGAAEAEVQELRAEVEELRRQVSELAESFERLRSQFGV